MDGWILFLIKVFLIKNNNTVKLIDTSNLWIIIYLYNYFYIFYELKVVIFIIKTEYQYS